MIRSFATVSLALMFLLAAPAAAVADKIGYVDYEKVLRDSAAGKRASGKFERSLKKRQVEIDKKQKALQSDARKLEKQASALKPSVVEQRKREIEARFLEVQQTYQKLEKELTVERTRLIQKVIEQSRPVVKALAEKGGFDVVLDRSAVVWSKSGLDLTDAVIKRLK